MVHATGMLELMPQYETQYLMPARVSSRGSGKAMEEYIIFGVGGVTCERS